jgi:hypothetical protein
MMNIMPIMNVFGWNYGFMYQDINNINEKISIVKDVISLN